VTRGRGATIAATLLGCSVFAGCGPSSKEPNSPRSDPSAPAAAPSAAGGAARHVRRADAEVAAALDLVSRVRKLDVKAKVPGFLLNREELHLEVERTLKDEAPDVLIEGNTELLYAFDIVGADFDLRSALTQMYGAQLAGFYDPDEDRMVLASDLSKDEQALTLYHELVHALQDQHFDLAGELDWKPEESDRQTALQALAEGDATLAMLDVARAAAGLGPGDFPAELLQIDALLMQANPKLDEVPGFLVRAMVSPYADGLRFVSDIRKRGGWAAVNEVWRHRPSSTEQILHPEKYLSREPVRPVAPLSLPSEFSAPSFREVMGEQGLKLLFEEWAPASAAANAATGWGGDRIAIANSSAGTTVFWHLEFDDEDAARRALVSMARGALRDELGRGSPKVRPTVDGATAEKAVSSGRFCRARPARGPFAIVRHGTHLGVTLGPYRRGRIADASADKCPDALAWADTLARQSGRPDSPAKSQ
jgi:hypothetical protein